MLRLILILITVFIIAYFLRGLIRTISSFFNKSEPPPVVKKKGTDEKKKIPYDKSKAVDAEFEDIK
jgi:Na+-transporting methylmalonyl-CoA/oxaloacetate decarboxylase gamma subunit